MYAEVPNFGAACNLTILLFISFAYLGKGSSALSASSASMASTVRADAVSVRNSLNFSCISIFVRSKFCMGMNFDRRNWYLVVLYDTSSN